MTSLKKKIVVAVLLFPIAVCAYSQNLDKQLDTVQCNYEYIDTTFGIADVYDVSIDTFSIDNVHFRMVHEKERGNGVDNITIEKNIGGLWIRCLKSFDIGNHNGYDFKDINGDGYDDFVYYWKWYGEVYFFDPELDNFIDVSTVTTASDWELIDSANNIFCDLEQGKQDEPIYSTLYTYFNGIIGY